MIGIYKITNPKGKIYIGQSNNIEKRFNQYKNLHCKLQKILYNSFIKYGVENHKFEIVLECIKEELNIYEKYYQELFSCVGNNGLNCFVIGCDKEKRFYSEYTKKNILLGRKNINRIYTDEQRLKISLRLRGEKNHMFGRIGELNSFYGRKHTEETKQKISNKNKGENNVFYGKKRPEHSEKMKGKNHFNFGKKRESISLMNKERIGLKNPRAIIYLDINNGVFYYSAYDYCKIHNIDNSTFRYRFKNNKINNLIRV